MTSLKDRSVPDLIMIFLAGVAGIVFVLFAGLIVWEALFRPDVDLGNLLHRISGLESSLLSACIGYAAGRGVKGSGNGKGEG